MAADYNNINDDIIVIYFYVKLFYIKYNLNQDEI